MLSELFWILAGVTYAGSQIYKEQVFPRNEAEFLKSIGCNTERQRQLMFLRSEGIRGKEEFDRLAGYDWKCKNISASDYVVREIAYREGWTYFGDEIMCSPAYLKALKSKKDRIQKAEEMYARIKPYPERQKFLLDLACSKNLMKREEFKEIIRRNYNPDDPISIRVALEGIAWSEGWLYVEP